MTEMSGAEFRCLREFLGLNSAWMAKHLDVNERTVLRWEFERNEVRDFARLAILTINGNAEQLVDALADACTEQSPVIRTYRTDEHFQDDTGLPYPASWHRAAATRAALKVGYARIEYRSETT